ncbi:MarR family transcriptional regulator [Caballeronia arvi]|uniref:MarR family transcriptional regulator n=1 Tax=Caballeronia arvi TaxID=1777135 RepID=A0A158KYL0_9BURK|nr:MarR family transcriptional regulator [Caballeronia arvi]
MIDREVYGESCPRKKDLERVSHFRYVFRTFLRYSPGIDNAVSRDHPVSIFPATSRARHVGTLPGDGRALAERLQAASNGTGAWVSRGERAQLVARKVGDKDRRHAQVHVTRKGERCLYKLAALHLDHVSEFERLLAET